LGSFEKNAGSIRGMPDYTSRLIKEYVLGFPLGDGGFWTNRFLDATVATRGFSTGEMVVFRILVATWKFDARFSSRHWMEVFNPAFLGYGWRIF